jgi:hypothetical protein
MNTQIFTVETWKPEFIIKSYPELVGIFTRGQNAILSYFHNWARHLAEKVENAGAWVFVTINQIAKETGYSNSSVSRLIQEINERCPGAIDKRTKWFNHTKYYATSCNEYRVNWPEVLKLLASYFSNPPSYSSTPLSQDEQSYKDQFKDPFKEKNTHTGENENFALECEPRVDINFADEIKEDQRGLTLQKEVYSTTLEQTDQIFEASIQSSKGNSSAPKLKKQDDMTINNSQAAAMGLIKQQDADGNIAYVPNPMGKQYGRRTWIDQGLALGFWPSRDHAIEYNQALITYARNQDWCKSPNSYASKQIADLLAGNSPAADRLWEAWVAGFPIGWEDLFDWEISPGVVNPAFSNWVGLSLFDSKLSAAANAANVSKQIKFNAKLLWERYAREVSREVEQIAIHAGRGQTYLPPGSLLPRNDQPDHSQTRDNINLLMQAAGRVQQAAALNPVTLAELMPAIEQEVQPEMTIEEYQSIDPWSDIDTKMSDLVQKVSVTPIEPPKFELHDYWYQIDSEDLGGSIEALEIVEMGEPPSLESQQLSLHVDISLNALYPPVKVTKPLSIELIPLISAKAKHLQDSWRRRKCPFSVNLAAKYLIWQMRGDDAMKAEAVEWLEQNYNRFKNL